MNWLRSDSENATPAAPGGSFEIQWNQRDRGHELPANPVKGSQSSSRLATARVESTSGAVGSARRSVMDARRLLNNGELGIFTKPFFKNLQEKVDSAAGPRGAAAPTRRNPPMQRSGRGPRSYAASFVVNDAFNIAASSLLASDSQDPVARPTTLPPRPARGPRSPPRRAPPTGG